MHPIEASFCGTWRCTPSSTRPFIDEGRARPRKAHSQASGPVRPFYSLSRRARICGHGTRVPGRRPLTSTSNKGSCLSPHLPDSFKKALLQPRQPDKTMDSKRLFSGRG